MIQEHWDVKPKNKQGTMHSPNGMQLAKWSGSTQSKYISDVTSAY